METLSYIVLILLSLVGYSAGINVKTEKTVDFKPQPIDSFIVLIIWAAAIFSRTTYNLNKWLLILIWLVLSIIIGSLSIWLRKLKKDKASSTKKTEATTKHPLKVKNLWSQWKNFSKKMGGFQSRIILTYFFFIVVTPFALVIKIFSDPLNIKSQILLSHWKQKEEINIDLEQFRRQF